MSPIQRCLKNKKKSRRRGRRGGGGGEENEGINNYSSFNYALPNFRIRATVQMLSRNLNKLIRKEKN
jgi:hypothetical protein